MRTTIAAALRETQKGVSGSSHRKFALFEYAHQQAPIQYPDKPHQPPLRRVAAHGVPAKDQIQAELSPRDQHGEEHQDQRDRIVQRLQRRDLAENLERGELREGARARRPPPTRHRLVVAGCGRGEGKREGVSLSTLTSRNGRSGLGARARDATARFGRLERRCRVKKETGRSPDFRVSRAQSTSRSAKGGFGRRNVGKRIAKQSWLFLSPFKSPSAKRYRMAMCC